MVAAESASPRALDELDQALLRELRGNGRMAISELARRVGAAESTCHKRVGALVESGVITGFRAEVDPAALGLSIEVLISIRVHPHARRSLTRFQAYLTDLPESRQVYFLAGDRDFLVHAAVRDTEALRALVSDRIRYARGGRVHQHEPDLRPLAAMRSAHWLLPIDPAAHAEHLPGDWRTRADATAVWDAIGRSQPIRRWCLRTGFRIMRPGDLVWAYLSRRQELCAVGTVAEIVQEDGAWFVHIDWDGPRTAQLCRDPLPRGAFGQVPMSTCRAGEPATEVLAACHGALAARGM